MSSSYKLDPKYDSPKVIYLNSKDATVYTEQNNFGDPLHTNCLFNLEEKLVIPENQMSLISLYSATIPHSFYNVRNGINDNIPMSLLLVGYDSSGCVAESTFKFIIQLDDGNYDTDKLIDQFLNGWQSSTNGEFLFNENDYIGFNDIVITGTNMYKTDNTTPLDGMKLGDIFDLTIKYNAVNNVFRFLMKSKVATPIDFFKFADFHFIWNTAPIIGSSITGNTDNLANALFGFSGKLDYPYRSTQLYPNNDIWGIVSEADPYNAQQLSSVLQSEQVIDLNDNIHGLMLRTNLVSKSSLTSQMSVFSNILGRIPITTLNHNQNDLEQGGMIYFNSNGHTHQSLVDLKSINILGIRLTDDNGRTIDLNGLDFQVSIQIQFVEHSSIAPTQSLLDEETQKSVELLNPKTPKKSKKKKDKN